MTTLNSQCRNNSEHSLKLDSSIFNILLHLSPHILSQSLMVNDCVHTYNLFSLELFKVDFVHHSSLPPKVSMCMNKDILFKINTVVSSGNLTLIKYFYVNIGCLPV